MLIVRASFRCQVTLLGNSKCWIPRRTNHNRVHMHVCVYIYKQTKKVLKDTSTDLYRLILVKTLHTNTWRSHTWRSHTCRSHTWRSHTGRSHTWRSHTIYFHDAFCTCRCCGFCYITHGTMHLFYWGTNMDSWTAIKGELEQSRGSTLHIGTSNGFLRALVLYKLRHLIPTESIPLIFALYILYVLGNHLL